MLSKPAPLATHKPYTLSLSIVHIPPDSIHSCLWYSGFHTEKNTNVQSSHSQSHIAVYETIIRLFSSKTPFSTHKYSAVTRPKVTSCVAARKWSWLVGGSSLAVQQRWLAASQWACLYLTQQHSVIYWLCHLTAYSPAATATTMANNELCNASFAHLSYITTTCNIDWVGFNVPLNTL